MARVQKEEIGIINMRYIVSRNPTAPRKWQKFADTKQSFW